MPDGSIDPTHDYVAELSSQTRKAWPTIAAAQADAIDVQNLLYNALYQFTSEDADLVVFGSLARLEWTSGSDVDWTMLIDGQVNQQHRHTARIVEEKLKGLQFKRTSLKGPGSEGIFGNMAFSHEIVHHIGGQTDTNRNTTQRILLLLEATALRKPNDRADGPFERVVRQILGRYLASDSNYHTQADQQSRIPRFLLNDIVRYWRTMCVDFAYKDWEQGGKKWALRNIKLRTSRKLLFVAGLLMVFSCFQNESLRRDETQSGDYMLKLEGHLLNYVHSTPLNIVVQILTEIGLHEPCAELLNEYEQFLAKINDTQTMIGNKTIRDHLAGLSEQDVYDDDCFLECREISHRMQATLKKMCFDIDSPLREFTCEYGVF